MQKKVLNLQIFLEFMCYTLFAVLMLYLVSSGKYQSYVTPKMVPYFYFTAIVMIIWACAELFRLFRVQHKPRIVHCFVLLIPAMLLLLPHSPVDVSNTSSGYLSGNAFLTGKNSFGIFNGNKSSGKSNTKAPANVSAVNIPAKSSTAASNDTSDIGNTSSTDTPLPNSSELDSSETASVSQSEVPEEEPTHIPPGLDIKSKKITVQNKDFALWLLEIYTNMQKYEGYKISITGFVYKDPNIMTKNEFMPARLAMTCCVADLTPCGMLCKYDKASELKADTWITVEGIIHKGKTMGYDEPQVTVTKISPAQEVTGYIYPY